MAKSFNITNPVAEMILNGDTSGERGEARPSASGRASSKGEGDKRSGEKKMVKTISISQALHRSIMRLVAQKTIDNPEKPYSFSSLVEEALKGYVEENKRK